MCERVSVWIKLSECKSDWIELFLSHLGTLPANWLGWLGSLQRKIQRIAKLLMIYMIEIKGSAFKLSTVSFSGWCGWRVHLYASVSRSMQRNLEFTTDNQSCEVRSTITLGYVSPELWLARHSDGWSLADVQRILIPAYELMHERGNICGSRTPQEGAKSVALQDCPKRLHYIGSRHLKLAPYV